MKGIQEEIKILKIQKTRNDSIIYFKKELLENDQKDFVKFDILLGFSEIAFNKEYDKAIITVSSSISKLSGGKGIYFLERKNDTWIVKCNKSLSIS